MARDRIVVGLDGSAESREALAWAVREANRRRATVLVVTAWPSAARSAAREAGKLMAARVRLHQTQRDAVAAATEGMTERPLVASEIVLADPVTALSHAADFADLVVIGGDGTHSLRPTSIASEVAHRLAHRSHVSGPVRVVVATPTAVPSPRTGDGIAGETTVTLAAIA